MIVVAQYLLYLVIVNKLWFVYIVIQSKAYFYYIFDICCAHKPFCTTYIFYICDFDNYFVIC
jgi:hypothetical protein